MSSLRGISRPTSTSVSSSPLTQIGPEDAVLNDIELELREMWRRRNVRVLTTGGDVGKGGNVWRGAMKEGEISKVTTQDRVAQLLNRIDTELTFDKDAKEVGEIAFFQPNRNQRSREPVREVPGPRTTHAVLVVDIVECEEESILEPSLCASPIAASPSPTPSPRGGAFPVPTQFSNGDEDSYFCGSPLRPLYEPTPIGFQRVPSQSVASTSDADLDYGISPLTVRSASIPLGDNDCSQPPPTHTTTTSRWPSGSVGLGARSTVTRIPPPPTSLR